MKFYNLLSLQIVSKSDICVCRIDFIINLFKFKKESLKLVNLFNVRKLPMNKCLKILLLATTVLKCGSIYASNSQLVPFVEPSPAPNHGVIAMHVSPVAHSNGALQPAFNGFVVPRSSSVNQRILTLSASAGNVLQKRQEYADTLVTINSKTLEVNRFHDIEEDIVGSVEQYCGLVSTSEELAVSVQNRLDLINSKNAKGQKKIIGFKKLLSDDTKYLELRNKDLQELDSALSNIVSGDSVSELLKKYGVMFADQQQDVGDTGDTGGNVTSISNNTNSNVTGVNNNEDDNSSASSVSDSGELGEGQI